MSTFLVTGVGGPAGRNVAALLLERGHRVVGTDMQAISPEGITFYQVAAANDPGLLPSIHQIARREKVDLVIPTVSEELIVFAKGWQWADKIPVLVSPAKAVETANDKYLTSLALSTHAVEVPRFALPSQIHSAAELAEKIGWPCISKPRVSRGGREVSLHSAEDWPLIAAMSDRFILQEFAAGVDYAPNVFAGPGGKNVIVSLEKTELKEGIIGNAKKVVRTDTPDVADLAGRAAAAVGLTGPLDVDVRRRRDGVPVVLEINARFGANIRYASEVLDAAIEAFS